MEIKIDLKNVLKLSYELIDGSKVEYVDEEYKNDSESEHIDEEDIEEAIRKFNESDFKQVNLTADEYAECVKSVLDPYSGGVKNYHTFRIIRKLIDALKNAKEKYERGLVNFENLFKNKDEEDKCANISNCIDTIASEIDGFIDLDKAKEKDIEKYDSFLNKLKKIDKAIFEKENEKEIKAKKSLENKKNLTKDELFNALRFNWILDKSVEMTKKGINQRLFGEYKFIADEIVVALLQKLAEGREFNDELIEEVKKECEDIKPHEGTPFYLFDNLDYDELKEYEKENNE